MVDNTVIVKRPDGSILVRGEHCGGVEDIIVSQYPDGDILIRDIGDNEAVIIQPRQLNAVITLLDLMDEEAREEDEEFESEDDFGFSADADEFDVEFSPEEWEEMLDDERDEDAEAAFLRGFMDAMNGFFGFPEGEIDEYHV